MKGNQYRRPARKRGMSLALAILLVVAQLGGVLLPAGPAQAAPQFTIDPVAVPAASLPIRVTVTATQSAFTAGNTTPYLRQGDSTVAASISGITSTATALSFNVGAGLSAGTYTIRAVSPAGTYDTGTLTVGNPSITAVSPSTLAYNYDEQVSVTVTGQNTNFALAESTVEILDTSNQVMGKVGGVTAAASVNSLTFTLQTGLASGSYKVRVTTPTVQDKVETVTSAAILQVRGTPSIGLSPAQVAVGYTTTTVTVTGTDTGFSGATTVAVLDGDGVSTGKAGSPSVASATSLTFSLANGLTAGSYTVKTVTGSEEVTAALTVATPSAALQYQGTSFTQLAAGYSASQTLTVSGTDTSFATGNSDILLLDPAGEDVTATYVSNKSFSSTTTATFTLGTGLDEAGDYTVTVTTAGQSDVSATFELVSPTVQSMTFSSPVVSGSSVPKGYADTQVTVVGSNSAFSADTTVEVVGQIGKTESISVQSATQLTFTLKSGLDAADYTVRVDVDGDSGTTADRATSSITVTTPSITQVSPATVANNSATPVTMTVRGQNTHFTEATPSVDILGVATETISSITVVSDTELTCSLTPNSIAAGGTYSVSVSTSSSNITETAVGTDVLTISSSSFTVTPSVVYTDELGSKQASVTGDGTNFVAGTTKARMDSGSAMSGVTVGSTTSLTFTVPADLDAGWHTVGIDQTNDGTFELTNPIEVRSRSISLSSNKKTFNYGVFDMSVSGQGVTFTDNNLPTVKIMQGGSTVQTIAGNSVSKVAGENKVKFAFPTGLASGDYTVRLTWASGDYQNLTLDAAFQVENEVTSLYLKKGTQRLYGTLTQKANDAAFDLTAFGVLKAGGEDQNKTTSATWAVTSGDDVVGVDDFSNKGRVTIKKDGTATVTATYDGQTVSVTITVQPYLTGISVTPATVKLKYGGSSATASVTANYSNNTSQAVSASDVTWSVVAPGTAVTVSQGTITPVSAGSATVRASYSGKTADVSVTVLGIQEQGVTLTTSDADKTIKVGETLSITVTVKWTDDTVETVTGSATWGSGSNSIATVTGGVVTGVAQGTATITATYRGTSGTMQVTVQPLVTLSSVSISGDSTVVTGATLNLSAFANMSDGTKPSVTTQAAWSSSEPSVATVGAATGVVTGVSAGTTDITAAYGDKSAQVTVTVQDLTINSISLSGGSTVIEKLTLALTATAHLNNSTTQNVTDSTDWESSDEAVATISGAGLVTGVAAGTATITATYFEKTAQVVVSVTAPTVSSINVIGTTNTVLVAKTLQLTAGASLSNFETENVTSSATWDSSSDAVATVSTSGLVTGVAAGTVTITASYGDESGTMQVTVQDPTVNSISISGGNTVQAGSNLNLTATASMSNDTTQNVTTSAEWSSNNTAAASVGAGTGVVTGVAVGSATITATYGDRSDTQSVTVTAATPGGGGGGGGTTVVPASPTGQTDTKISVLKEILGNTGTNETDITAGTKGVADALKTAADAETDASKVTGTAQDAADTLSQAGKQVTSEAGAIAVAQDNVTVLEALAIAAGKVTDAATGKQVLGAVSASTNNVGDLLDKVTTTEKAIELVENVISSAAKVIAGVDLAGSETNQLKEEVLKVAQKAIDKAGQTTFQPVSSAEGKVSAQPDINTLTATIDNMVKTAADLQTAISSSNMDLNRAVEKKIVIDVPVATDVTEVTTALPAGLLTQVKDKGLDKVEIVTGVATISVAPDSFSTGDQAKLINLSARKADQSSLTPAQKAQVGNNPVFEFNAAVTSSGSSNQSVSSFSKAVEIKVPYQPALGELGDGITVFYVNDQGVLENKIGLYDASTGKIGFSTQHFSAFFVKESIKSFDDLGGVPWAAMGIWVLAGKGVINGKSASGFAPADDITRAEFAALVVRMLQLPTSGATEPFADVSAGAWYYKEVAAAYQNGIIKGRSQSVFDPNGKITRQEMATIISNVLLTRKYRVGSERDLEEFTDRSGIASWAVSPVGLAAREGIVTGMGDGKFAPTANATRAQAAVMLYRLFKK